VGRGGTRRGREFIGGDAAKVDKYGGEEGRSHLKGLGRRGRSRV